MKQVKLDSLNTELQKIWKNFVFHDPSELHPVYFRSVSPSPITFVGMNPSFNEKGMMKTIKDTKYENLKPSEYFRVSNKSFTIAASNQISEISEQKYLTFYKQHQELTTKLNLEHFNHLDLFQYRQTNQKKFLGKVLNRDESLNEFGRAQFALFLKALELTNPKIIVVANAKAGRLIKSHLKLCFSKELGTYEINVAGTLVPIFISGMLTGGRALDIFSRERFFWHIEKVYKKQ